jgi:hypothetical protein
MKISLLLLSALAGSALAEPPMTDRITPEEMSKLQGATSPIEALKKEQQQTVDPKKDKVERASEQSLIKQSDILHDGSNWTIVPKGAVLHVPAQMAPRVGAKPLGTLLSWDDFLMANRAWISTEEVSFEQAAGKQPLVAAHKEYWPTQTKVIVAVYHGGPISVRTPQPAPAVTQK